MLTVRSSENNERFKAFLIFSRFMTGVNLKVDYGKYPDTGMGLGVNSPLSDFLLKTKLPSDLRDFILVIDRYIQRRLSTGYNEVGVLDDVLLHLNMSRREYHRNLWKARLREAKRTDSIPRNYELTLYPEYFDAIKNGVKTVEGRDYSDKETYHTWLPEDTVTFTKLSSAENGQITGEKLKARITQINHYENVREMLKNEGWKNMQPNATSLKDAIGRYYAIDESYEDRIQAEGIFAIHIELLDICP